MAATSTSRPWEVDSPAKQYNATPKSQLPSFSSLTGALPDRTSGISHLSSPSSVRERDSGAWSSHPQSTRSSTYSTNTSSYTFPSNTNSYYMAQNRGSTMSNSSHFGSTSHPSADYSVPSSSALSSPGFSAGNNVLPSINQAKEPNRESRDFPPQESRRSSIGSSVNQGMNSLAINGNSPYNNTSANPSSVSLSQNLSRERGIPTTNGLRTSRSSAQLPMSPMPSHAEQRPAFGRVAPPIGRNPRSEVYNANEPIPGQAYAFPDAPDSQPGALPPKSSHGSRSNVTKIEEDMDVYPHHESGHHSVASSIHTLDSRLPPGQRHLDDGNSTYQHSITSDHQMRRTSGTESMTPEDTTQPYSRTPALRVSHKMAERKRRSEMKDLFENLRSQIPSNQGSKSSKWEILTKASEYIKQLESAASSGHTNEKQLRMAFSDLDMTRRDNDGLRNENQRLAQELALLRGQQQQQQQQQQHPQSHPTAQPTPPQQSTSIYSAPQHYVPPPPPPPPAMNDPARNLPPLNNMANNSSSMQGIQYSHEHR
ncbi:MAG: hypothetical protein GOMPHAMPRED_002141 [Gomphillus americanus]|uniref:BHLH domain-containing protein n=1 Tax=Gomphillus americanus TaxID=1940652 RepID=A0A8H3FC03_9LECA|nr:MAG: hypothetical protein GOMPHAMPRED_002141 [Gomphillus americanus]